jgi:hypothetical protein
LPIRNTSEEVCFVSLQSYGPQSKASDAIEAIGRKFVPYEVKNIELDE